MRTKTLLLTAALSAVGIATSSAQVYSVNIVGYVSHTLSPGLSLICNPFVVGNTNISALIPVAPSGTQVSIFNTQTANFDASLFDDLAGEWSNANLPLRLGSGFFISVPPGSTFPLTFVGEVLTGNNIANSPTSQGYQILSSKVPQDGTLGAMGLVPGDGDQVQRWGFGVQNFIGYLYDGLGGEWVGPAGTDPVNGPFVKAGEAFFYNLAPGSTATWVRNFNP